MNKKTILAIFSAFLWTGIIQGSPAVPGATSAEAEFLKLKNRGLYREALRKIGSDAPGADERRCELGLLRVFELMKYPDLSESARGALEGFSASGKVASVPLLRARLDQARWALMLKKGNISGAGKLVGSYKYLDFAVAGPFDCAGLDSFEKERGPETDPSRSSSYQGRYGRVSWSDVSPDRSGVIDMGELLPERSDVLYYFFREIEIVNSGEYDILLGKTGYADIYLDGSPVFSSRAGHSFFHDQFRIRVRMDAGRHRLLVKTGFSRTGTRLSMRIADGSGLPAAFPRPNGDAVSAPSSLIGSAPYTLFAGDPASSDDSFMTGYFCFTAGLFSDEDDRPRSYFEAVDPGSVYYSSALYYLGTAETDDENALDYFRLSYAAGSGNLEAGIELMRRKIGLDQFEEAYEILSSMEAYSGSSPLCRQAMAEYFAARNWDLEARKRTAALRESMPCEAALIEAEMDAGTGDYADAAGAMRFVAASDRYDTLLAERYVRLCALSGKTAEAETVLFDTVALHPENMRFRVLLAEARRGRSDGSALSCLTSGLNISPNNPDILSALAREYISIGKNDVAAFYLRKAVEADPENISLKRQLDLLLQNGGDLSRYTLHEDIRSLADRARAYGDEPAVVLLDESVTWLNGDGSEERRVRKVVLINDDSASEDFAMQHVVFSPETEKVENLSCLVWKNGSSRVISERYMKSLSDPESRLYYDLSALVIPVSGITAGDVLDISYTVRAQCGDDGCGSFGRAFVLGDRYRTMEFNHVVAVSHLKKVYCRPVNGAKAPPSPSDEKDRLIYMIREHNLPPYRQEPGMPGEDSFLPAVIFTSFGSWDELFDWYRALLSGRKIVSEEMKAAVRRLTSGTSDPAEKARRIYNHVASEIRYVGFEFGMGGIRPRRSDLTYSSRMGDCKDMALVLEAMLEEAGLDADLALVRTYENGDFDRSVPYLGYFNHALCCVHLDAPLFLDTTADYSGFRDLPESDRSIAALVIGDKSCGFVTTGGTQFNDSIVKVNNRIVIDQDGGAVISRTLKKHGPSATEIRAGLADSGKKTRSLVEYWNRRYTGARVENLKIVSIDVDSPAEYSYEINTPSFCEKTDTDLIVQAFLSPSGLFDTYTLLSRRDSPLLLFETGKTEITSIITLPAGYTVHSLPENESSGSREYSASYSYEMQGASIVVRSVIDIREKRIDPGMYKTFRDFAAFISRKEREKIILGKISR